MTELPEGVAAELRRIGSTLPEVEAHGNGSRLTLKVGRRVVATTITIDGEQAPVTVMSVRGDEAEIEFLVETGHPFFRLRSGGPDRIGVVLDDATDWNEIAERVTDSYLAVAPRRLTKDFDLPAR